MIESNPAGLVWQREPGFYFYKGDQARNYLRELSADLKGNWWLDDFYDISKLPQDKLPLVFRDNQKVSFMEYIQRFFVVVADQADLKAKAKMEEIKKANQQLKRLNEVISLIGEIDARSPDDSDSAKVRESIVITVRSRWPDATTYTFNIGSSTGPLTVPMSIEMAASPGMLFSTVSYEGAKFREEYDSALSGIGVDPQQSEYKIGESTDGAGIARTVRTLQAEATARGNNLQSLMAQTSSTINFQSAVHEGYKSYGERWYQMLAQSSTTS